MCQKLKDKDLQNLTNNVPQPPLTITLIFPAFICGLLIGKDGTKIKEIRKSTGASIRVATHFLPNSTEKAVTISGTVTAIIDCMQQVYQILMVAKPITYKPFHPNPSYDPDMVVTSGAATAAAQQQTVQYLMAVMMLQNQWQLFQAQQQFNILHAAVAQNPATAVIGNTISMFNNQEVGSCSECHNFAQTAYSINVGRAGRAGSSQMEPESTTTSLSSVATVLPLAANRRRFLPY
uniref:K Homology domain-containing protein n=1 Tax=Panagrolaimus sp. ES5 TaxID=591445 RepID=A0AC34GTN5_9BILA